MVRPNREGVQFDGPRSPEEIRELPLEVGFVVLPLVTD